MGYTIDELPVIDSLDPNDKLPVWSGGSQAITLLNFRRLLAAQPPLISSGGITDLTTDQQALIYAGVAVATVDGKRWLYTGTGSKTSESSYIEFGDVSWAALNQKPQALVDIAGLSPSDNDSLWRKAGRWVSRTIAQVKQDLGIDRVNNTSDAEKPISTAQQAAIDAVSSVASAAAASANLRILLTAIGAANGVAPLDGGSKIPASFLPATVMEYMGTWDASTNTPSLANGDPNYNTGAVYTVSVAGQVNFGAGAITFRVGDWAVYNGTKWEHSPASDEVISINGKSGAVVISTSDIPEGTSNFYFTTARAQAAAIAAALGSGLTPYLTTKQAITVNDTVLSALGKLQAQVISCVQTNGTIASIVSISQTDYNNLAVKDPYTLYLIS
jgi:hypothetical protein